MRTSLVNKCAGIAALAGILSVCGGCVLIRGKSFGHWAQSGEAVPMIRIHGDRLNQPLPENLPVAILPVLSDTMPKANLDTLNSALIQESKNYFYADIIDVDRRGKMAEYVTSANLAPIEGIFNTAEVGRIGRLVGAPYVLCSRALNFRLHPPQLLAIEFVLVETESFSPVLEMTAIFDADEQVTLIAADRHLRMRVSKPYNRTNLDILLRSPAQYATFVSAQCMRTLASAMWKKREKH